MWIWIKPRLPIESYRWSDVKLVNQICLGEFYGSWMCMIYRTILNGMNNQQKQNWGGGAPPCSDFQFWPILFWGTDPRSKLMRIVCHGVLQSQPRRNKPQGCRSGGVPLCFRGSPSWSQGWSIQGWYLPFLVHDCPIISPWFVAAPYFLCVIPSNSIEGG